MNRRTTLRALAAAGAVAAAGCLGSSTEEVPDPVDLSGGTFDDRGGMEIGPHGGANGQLFYREQTPPERERGPFWFHTLVFGLFPFYFDRRDRGWDTEVVYVTDFSTVDWTVKQREGTPTMPSPTAPETFADASGLTYVAESSVNGGMGPGLHPFADDAEAASFADEYGGRTISFDEVTPQLLGQLREQGASPAGGHSHDDSADHPGSDSHDGHSHDDSDDTTHSHNHSDDAAHPHDHPDGDSRSHSINGTLAGDAVDGDR